MFVSKETVPVANGALGLDKKGQGKYEEKIPGNINIEELQKISLLGTAHILRKVLSTKKVISPPPPTPRFGAAPKETGCFSEPWTVQTAAKEDEKRKIIIIITRSSVQSFPVTVTIMTLFPSVSLPRRRF